MGFQFNPDLYDEKIRQKYLEAERNREKVYQQYPEVREVDDILHQLKKEYRLLQVRKVLQVPSEKSKGTSTTLKSLKEEITALEKKYQELLENYNISPDFKEPHWDCPRCMDTGRVLEKGITVPCRCSFSQRREILLKRSGLPKRLVRANFQDLRLDLYPEEPMEDNPERTFRENANLVFNQAKNFAYKFQVNKPMQGLLIEGNTGSGKSYLLGCITNYLIDRDMEARYIVYSELIHSIKTSFNADSELSADQILRELQEVPVLLIDDLGSEYITDFTGSVLYQIIDGRYREEKPFIVTSNFSPNELSQRMGLMGERIFDRVVETCDYYQLAGDIRAQIVLARRGDDN